MRWKWLDAYRVMEWNQNDLEWILNEVKMTGWHMDAYGRMGWNQNDSWMTDWHWEGESGTGMMGWLLNEVKMTGCLRNDGMKSKWLLDGGLTLGGWEWHWEVGMTSKWSENDGMPTEWWDEIKMTNGWRTDIRRVEVALGWWDGF